MRVLVTGGAGYIGSVVAAQLLAAGHEVVVLDDLSRGHAAAVPPGAEHVARLAAGPGRARRAAVAGIDAVLHFAALSLVAESVEHPERYWHNNVVGTRNLLDAMRAAGVGRLVFSSTAATYGEPERIPITEDEPTAPVNAYGASKLAVDLMLRDECVAHGLAAASLRYFNVAGASGALGEDHEPETHLIPLVLQAAAGVREHITVFGTDYPTRDGTAVRDYIHVEDLGEAHLLALDRVQPGVAPRLQPRHRRRLHGARGDRGGAARDRAGDPGARGGPPARRPAAARRRQRARPRRAGLGAAARAGRDDRRRLGLAPGAPARLRAAEREQRHDARRRPRRTTERGGCVASITAKRSGSAAASSS